MSVKKFIESGIIESYVLGLCTPGELKQVKAMRAKHPTVKAEIKAVRVALLEYALKNEVKPSEQLKEKIFSALKFSETKPEVKKEEQKKTEKETRDKEEQKKEIKTEEKKSEMPPEISSPTVIKASEEIRSTLGMPKTSEPEIKISTAKRQENKPEGKEKENVTISKEKKEGTITTGQKTKHEIKASREPVTGNQNRNGFETFKSFILVITLALLAASAYFSYYLYQDFIDKEKETTALKEGRDEHTQRLIADRESLEMQLAEKQSKLDSVISVAESMISDRETLLKSFKAISLTSNDAAKLSGTELQPGASAVVHWNRASHKAYISVQKLSPVDSTQQYHLWSMVDGKFIPAGTFEVSEEIPTLREVKDVNKADFFIVTIESFGTNTKPTMNAVCLAGKTF